MGSLKVDMSSIYMFVCVTLFTATPSANTYSTFTKTLQFLENQNARKWENVIIVSDDYVEGNEKDELRQTIYHDMFFNNNKLSFQFSMVKSHFNF